MAISDNADTLPEFLIAPNQRRSDARYVDVNPVQGEGVPVLVYDRVAVMASIRNLILAFRGTRSRIFTPDYFSGVYDMLQEPVDEKTGQLIGITLYQSIYKWEPRVRVSPSDITIVPDRNNQLYRVAIQLQFNGVRSTENFILRN
jgi:phage baseplate assembly protein W